jgi:hypothetical protein
MQKVEVKRKRGLAGGATASMRVVCRGAGGRVIGKEGDTVLCAVTQIAQSGCERLSLPWLWATWITAEKITRTTHTRAR